MYITYTTQLFSSVSSIVLYNNNRFLEYVIITVSLSLTSCVLTVLTATHVGRVSNTVMFFNLK